jgi:two-component system, sensor histidine kinase PdtaS
MCPAVRVYEQELQLRRSTETKLRETLFRESELLRQREELIRQTDILGKESEHRLLNGLQLIASLLAMQRQKF